MRRRRHAPIKVARHKQRRTSVWCGSGRRSSTRSATAKTNLSQGPLAPDVPDFVKLAEALGCVGLRCDSCRRRRRHVIEPGDRAINDRPVVIDFIVGAGRPWFGRWWPQASSNDEIQVGQGTFAPAVRLRDRRERDRRGHHPHQRDRSKQSRERRTSACTPCPSSSRTSPACWHAWHRACSRRRGFNIRVAGRRCDRTPKNLSAA